MIIHEGRLMRILPHGISIDKLGPSMLPIIFYGTILTSSSQMLGIHFKNLKSQHYEKTYFLRLGGIPLAARQYHWYVHFKRTDIKKKLLYVEPF